MWKSQLLVLTYLVQRHHLQLLLSRHREVSQLPPAGGNPVPSGLTQRGLLAREGLVFSVLHFVLIAPSQEQALMPRELPFSALMQGPTSQTGLSEPGRGS